MHAHFLAPDVLANWHADPDAVDREWFGQRSRCEHALFIEGAVVRELSLQRPADDLSAVGDDDSIIVEAFLANDGADHQRRPGVRRGSNEAIGAFVDAAHE